MTEPAKDTDTDTTPDTKVDAKGQKTVLVIRTVKHDGVLYREGDRIPADRKVLEALGALGALETKGAK